jgi:phosphoribosylglycinamide formyltransferase-1
MDLRIGVLASGRGSNFAALIRAIQEGRLRAEIRVLVSNRKGAGALDIAREHGIPAVFLSPKGYASPEEYDRAIMEVLETYGVNFVALAGYMRYITPGFVQKFRHRMVNIHPALLPSFGGKGMYGIHVHEAVLERGCKVTGVTVHIVDEQYDHGPIVLQRCVPVMEEDTPETLAARVLEQEHQVYAEALQLFAEDRVRVEGLRVRILPKK